jgi:hypothetical protein
MADSILCAIADTGEREGLGLDVYLCDDHAWSQGVPAGSCRGEARHL